MGWLIYFGGYIASFVTVFILAIVSGRNRIKNGKPVSGVLDLYAQHILLGVLFSFGSWATWIFLMGYVAIFAGSGKG
jgi:hypothetical protein